MFTKVILKVGAPCSGKGALGKAMRLLHGNLMEFLVMRDIIEARKKKDSAFAELSILCEKKGILVPTERVKEIVVEPVQVAQKTGKPYLMFDGLPREGDGQPLIVDDLFPRSDIHFVESVASDKYLDSVFLQTVNSPERAGRLDAEIDIHRGRVALYQRNLSSILRASAMRKWRHHRLDVENISLAMKVRRMETWLGLPPVPASRLENIEEELGLPKLVLA